ncbi:type I-E CRISPR-associated protein Cse2/CasB [Streptomyces sp. RY43-2]|uniref:Type I-E CRISPR-associated protein Cse2/CasB n=1 Tax=Streptomyces macrolidinus TaxID=2952607 RepID=A0ABT0ZGJ5_9ACTN|nr:type I-E CRISPR-associated protein Cse2/CasB [Streptomyces macrolidinus]MCN9242707.1 type I-E CRISPR-associated protein Cse2/CasB [Streptomyces macrolidinus]
MTTVSRPPRTSVPSQRSVGTPRLTGYRKFTDAVLHMCEREPGARAALRSGVRKDLDAVPRMHRVIAHLVPTDVSDDMQRAYYAIAAMIAEQARRQGAIADDTVDSADDEAAEPSAEVPPATAATSAEESDDGGRDYGTSLGVAFALAVINSPGRDRQMRRGAAESRLNILCKQGVTGLHRHLPASVRYLRSLDVPVDWARLLQDLVDWRRHSGRVTRRWLQDFYRHCQEDARNEADKRDSDEVAQPTGATDD